MYLLSKKEKKLMNKLPSNHILVKFLNLKVHTHTQFYKYTHSLTALTCLLTLRASWEMPLPLTSCCKDLPCSLADPSLLPFLRDACSTCQHILDLSLLVCLPPHREWAP